MRKAFLRLFSHAPLERRVFIETYGCQMNFNDTELVYGVFEKHNNAAKAFPSPGMFPVNASLTFARASSIELADVILLMTCAIRENAESKIWARLEALRGLQRRNSSVLIGLLGCMAERLKEELIEKRRLVHVVCGPDAYRDLPRLLKSASQGVAQVNTMLSADETYADISPVRINAEANGAYVSIMRGCNNMCSFCIVPFTRGRERSRPVQSISDEVARLVDSGVKEITLLGQNVNSYNDTSQASATQHHMSRGFTSISRSRSEGRRFVDLLDILSQNNPETRLRFTSPHPKDFPDHLIELIKDRSNICKQIHLPAQSGSSKVLESMRRGYSREAYIELVHLIREQIPNVALSSDFIAGFCGETDEDHKQTLSLIQSVDYDMAYLYAYSMREKTHAHRNMVDDVHPDIKQNRLREIIDQFYSRSKKRTQGYHGSRQLVLVDGISKKSADFLSGRADNNKVVVFPKVAVDGAIPKRGDFLEVRVEKSSGLTLIGSPLRLSSIAAYQCST